MPIGPSLPPTASGKTSPQITPRYLTETANEEEGEDDDDSYAPALPPDMLPSAQPATSKPIKGPMLPSLPSRLPRNVNDEDVDDDDYGPMPLPESASVSHDEDGDGVRDFLEKEERRKKNIEEASKPKKLKREDWMLIPPKSSDLLGNLNPTKLKARQFSRASGDGASRDAGPSTLWTETPAERQKRLAEEVMGKRKRTEEGGASERSIDESDLAEERKRKRRDDRVSKIVEEHNKSSRGASLVEMHTTSKPPKPSSADRDTPGIWDHSRDMAVTGRLIDDATRNRMIRDARGLGDRFGSSKNGRYM